MPAPRGKKRDILFIYGQHSSIERWFGVAQVLNRYGNLTMPDLPGFGGMESLYKIGKPATMDNLADYLATFIKLKYRNKKVTIAAMSMGFVVVTRMLQKYPSLTKNVDMLISIVGFVHHEDFVFKKRNKKLFKVLTRLLSRKWPSRIFRYTALQPFVLRLVWRHSPNAREKLADAAGDEFESSMKIELDLWRINDIRSQMRTYVEMLTLNNCKRRINLPVWHVAVRNDRYFDNNKVEEHMRRIFSDFSLLYANLDNHAPTIIADEKTAAPLIPPSLRRLLTQKPN
jgi:pimeloyl-ACP methyl ester carboxylesterase